MRATLHEGDAIPEPVLREAWALRVEHLTLARSVEDDWAYFSAFVRGSDRVIMTFADRSGRMQGFFTVAFLPVDIRGRRALLMYSKYYYFRRRYRGRPEGLIAPWRLLPWVLRRYGVRRLCFVTTAYPQSYVSLARTSGKVYSLREEGTPAWERDALIAFGHAFCGDAFDERTGLVKSATVADSEALPSKAASALAARYEALNPRWRDGFMLPILFHVNGGLVRHTARRVLRRTRR